MKSGLLAVQAGPTDLPISGWKGLLCGSEVRQAKLPRPLQLHRHEQLWRLGFQVYVLDNEK